jgi:hypothetical protein
MKVNNTRKITIELNTEEAALLMFTVNAMLAGTCGESEHKEFLNELCNELEMYLT